LPRTDSATLPVVSVPERTIRLVTVTQEDGLLTAVQLRTLRDLLEGRPAHDAGALADAARARLEGELASLGWQGAAEGLWLAEAARRTELFRASLPPFGRGGAALPMSELKMRAEVAAGGVVLSGKVDLLLMRPDPSGGRTPLRLAMDLKTGTPRSEHAEDMRFYALLIALRYGVPPYRVATFFLESGEWQAEDVTGETLGRAVDRVLAAASTALEMRGG